MLFLFSTTIIIIEINHFMIYVLTLDIVPPSLSLNIPMCAVIFRGEGKRQKKSFMIFSYILLANLT